ncbi:MAG: beta-ketoacyl-[acyl-carrier-protein] synthase family protein [Deltaproteobacteria bacterium]|nr:beta-ketoacyl-[acyl-carrier-protein] synthase family protein [Deltaproteobacteria bacterium]
MSEKKRIVITGMAINTRLGDNLDTFYDNLMAGKSGVTNWTMMDTSRIYSKVGGDLSEYNVREKLATLKPKLPLEQFKKLRRMVKRAPFTTKLSMLAAMDAYLDAGFKALDPFRTSLAVAGHNLNKMYQHENYLQFEEEPDYIDNLSSVHSLDTDHAGSVSEVLGIHGPIYTMGGACASGNIALRNTVDEIRHHDHDVGFVVGATLEFAPLDLHAMCLLGAISFQSFNDTPEQASRPYDAKREGFIPSHGTAVLVVEDLEHAKARGAKIYAEILGVTATSDANHLPTPSEEGQTRTMQRLLKNSGVAPEQVDYICAHATSTPLGDITEINSIKRVFGDHAKKLKINAPKSMLGHTCWSAAVVETVAGVMQMQKGWLHPSINIEERDSRVDLDVCANEPVEHQIEIMLKNSFGFGGINVCSLIKRYSN